ncbi:hypothetical protein KIN20_009077 [Parelaphostrongylus tenuis]|uniref:Uncharacterized protein n=1 Tax=Parelaphostrongylus tenuis TaxID=148309 RepID=A0AAD5QN39_PARTN|nr:hypothetical protein KIN20_009077 [Parelaphostrongylus tenuis]
MKEHAICPLDTANLRGFRTGDYGQLVRSPSILFHVADRFDKKIEGYIIPADGGIDTELSKSSHLCNGDTGDESLSE